MKIVSGGQTGADRGALEAALELRFDYGGWIPKGRKAEDGIVPLAFDRLQEHPSPEYQHRTYANVRDSDGTVIIARQPLAGGSKSTLRVVHEQEKPVCVFRASQAIHSPEGLVPMLRKWIAHHKIETLNVAGSRESRVPGLQVAVKQAIRLLLLQEVI